MQRRFVRVVSLGLLALVGALAGCTQESERSSRLVASLGADGYALFRVDGGGADRVAVLVEMRDPAPGTYVLLHSGNAPQSIGWFALDTSAVTPCREYGADAVERAELDCLVADGRGELVDMVTIGDDMILLPPTDEQAPARTPRTTIMRHEMCGCEGCQCSSASSSSSSYSSSSTSTQKPAKSDYYAVMRVERGRADRGSSTFAFEVRPFGNDDEDAAPGVTRVE